MVTFIIISAIAFVVITLYFLNRMRKLDNRIDEIYHNSLAMLGSIEANTARAKDNYRLIAQVNTEVEKVKGTIAELHKHEPTNEPAKEVEEELESLVPELEKERDDVDTSTLYARRINFARLRQQGADVKSAGAAVGVSYSTAKRYEQWRKDNKK